MISWSDEGAILASRPFGENAVIIEVFTATNGHQSGVVRGGASRKIAPILQPGAQVAVTWKARLDTHLGSFTVEPIRSRAAVAMADRLALAGLNSVCALLSFVLPEREAHDTLYHHTISLLDLLGQSDIWPLAYLRWEQTLLKELGFGMDLSACAVHGTNEELIYVSPKSGRAVSRQGAGEWADRMLPLPPVLAGKGNATHHDIITALGTTGYFLEHRLVKSIGNKPIPQARARLIETIGRAAANL